MGTTDIMVCAGMHLIVLLLPTEIQTSTNEHLGKVKLAKFQALLSHVINQHRDLPNRLFNACAHGDNIKPKVWMRKGKLRLTAH